MLKVLLSSNQPTDQPTWLTCHLPDWCHLQDITTRLTTYLSTQKGWKAELADVQRTVYPHKWSPISCRSSAGQGKFAGQRPTFYHGATQLHSSRPMRYHKQNITLCHYVNIHVQSTKFSPFNRSIQKTNKIRQWQNTRKLTLLTRTMTLAPDLMPYEARVAERSVRDRPAEINIK